MNRREFLRRDGANSRRTGALFLTVLLLLALTRVVPFTGAMSLRPYRQFQKGMSYSWGGKDTYLTEGSDKSLRDIAETGTQWVSLVVTWYQDTLNDDQIMPGEASPTDASVIHAIDLIHSLGMNVMLKPHVDVSDGEFRGSIQPSDRSKWFASYTSFILHYAQLASAEKVEQFCVGTELDSMSRYTNDWYSVIAAVRTSYNGTLLYASTSVYYYEGKTWNVWSQVHFYDRLDYLGIDAYFPLTDKIDPTLDEVKTAWAKYLRDFEGWENSALKPVPIVFTEIGWQSVHGTNLPEAWKLNSICDPSNSQYDLGKCILDPQEQAVLYEATFETFWNKPWFGGVFWWEWFPYGLVMPSGKPYGWGEGGLNDTNFSPHNKPAETILRSWYARPYVTEGTPANAVLALIAIQQAENANAIAMREGRTRGLDQAKDLLSQAIQAYDQEDVSRSETLASSAVKAADGAVSQREYDLAAAVVNQAYQKLSSLRNATLQSADAIQFRQQSDTEYTSALQALSSNEFDLAKAHANNASALADKAFRLEHSYQIASTSATLTMPQQPMTFLGNLMNAMAAIVVVMLVTISAIITKKKRRGKKE